MKKTNALLMFVAIATSLSVHSFASPAPDQEAKTRNCVSDIIQADLVFCKGDEVYLLPPLESNTRRLIGPLTIQQVNDQDDVLISLERYQKRPIHAFPGLEIAATHGCTDAGVCVGDIIRPTITSVRMRVVAIFNGGGVGATSCLGESHCRSQIRGSVYLFEQGEFTE